MENLKIGEYTRINGKIGIIKDIILNVNLYEDSGIYLDNEKIIMGKEEIHKLKSSKNITELLEVGDFVNGERIIALKKDIPERNIYFNSKDNSIFVDYDLANNWYFGINDEDIKSVVTKEQFNAVKYDVEG